MAWLTKEDLYYWGEGTHFLSYEKLGAHPNKTGCWFGVWAPHADEVAVIGDFNGWDAAAHPLKRTEAGLWEGFARGAQPGQCYKYRVRRGAYQADKSDPYAFAMEAPHPSGNALAGLSSVVTDLSYAWGDADWMAARPGPGQLDRPMSIYEVHLGSWLKGPDAYSLGYRDIAKPLADHVERMGFTHVEFLPLMEHPYYGSWGYQVVGYFAPTFRYGSPQDLMYLIDYLHRRGIGVIMDWVPAHFATDPQGLVFWDGSTLFEDDDPRMRHHPDWGTYVFDYAKPGVRNFLVGNALFWLDKYHVDGLRFDAVASMLYRDYSRGEWTPNRHGGREHLEAISLLKQVNEAVFAHHPTAMTIAEESTAWPGVSQPTYNGGLGFLFKWNMGWMHDTLAYASKDPVYRPYHHGNLTFPLVYAFSEHYVLPFSHDEVVHGKGSLWGKVPGDDWQKAANLRLLYGHMMGSPGKKLLFMGSEFGQRREWNHDAQLDWHLVDHPLHGGILRWVRDLNGLYREHAALWNDTPDGFRWLSLDDQANSVVAYLRQRGADQLVFVLNFTPVPRPNYRVGVPGHGVWEEVLNSDAGTYGGSGVGNMGALEATPVPLHGQPASVVLTLPPLGVLVLAPRPAAEARAAEARAAEALVSTSTAAPTPSR